MSPALLGVLRCAGCRSARLSDRGANVECAACGRLFPVQAGVPVMVTDALAERGPLLDPALAASVMERLGIPPGPVELLRVRHASGARMRLPGRPDLMAHDGQVLAGIPGAEPPGLPTGSEGRLQCEWLAEYLPRAMPPGAELLANVLFRNTSRCVMPATGDGWVTIATHWAGPDGMALPGEIRTPLPTDLAPGQAITLPVRIQAPTEPGQHTLGVALVQEGVRWLDQTYGPFPIRVTGAFGAVLPPHWVLDGPGPHDAAGDHRRALHLLRGWLGQLETARPRVLQAGGGARAASAPERYDLVVADADLLALQLGRLVPGHDALSVCADPAALPLAPGAFDAAVCFGALRYAADPAQMLRRLRDHVRPGGFIGLFCGPAGHVWPGTAPPAMLADMRRGLNPQSFSLQDYATIFSHAGLHAAELVVDGTSVKARLESLRADN